MARSTRYSKRRSTRRKRPARRYTRPKRVTRRPAMTRRRILNITTNKHQDNMPQWIPTDTTNPGGAGALADLHITANTTVVTTLFCATARVADLEGALSPAYRSSQNTYGRGYRETTTLRLQSGAPFRWRRLVFHAKGFAGLLVQNGLPSANFFLNTSNGQVRQTNTVSSTLDAIISQFVFRGTKNKDWFSPYNAKTDTTILSVVSDKTYTMNPNNASGLIKTVKNWYGINKNITYNDDEAGNSYDSSAFSTTGANSYGDLFIYDIFQSGDTETGEMLVNHEGTYYWHQRD